MRPDIPKRKFIKNSLMAAGAVYCGINNKFAGAVAFPSGIQANIHPSGYTSDLKYEARFYTHTPKGIKCLICPSECKIKEGESGECRTRTNSDNILFTKAYGNPCAVHVDPIEKKPLYHFLPSSKTFSIATAGCNLACLNCQNWEISQTSPDKTRNYDLMPEQVVEECIIKGCKSIAYTYSDPVAFYEYTYDTAKIARSKGIKNVLVSAGYINEEPLNEWCQYIDAANIDLKSFSNETYEALNGATLEPVLKTLKILKSRGVWLEITNLVIPNWTDDMGIIKEMCKWLYDNGFENTPLHFSRFHPLYKLTDLYPTPVSTLNMAYTHAKEAGLNYVYIGNVPEISAANTHCPECNKLIVERKGFTVLSKSIENNHCKYCKAEIQGSW